MNIVFDSYLAHIRLISTSSADAFLPDASAKDLLASCLERIELLPSCDRLGVYQFTGFSFGLILGEVPGGWTALVGLPDEVASFAADIGTHFPIYQLIL
jgi:hypothetical protein